MIIKSKMKRFATILLAAAMAASVFSGCGGGSGTSTASSAASTASSAASSAASSQAPAETTSGDNILRYGTTSIEGRFNPIMSDNIYDSAVVDSIFESLIIVDPEGNYITGHMVESMTMENDNATYVFKIKDAVKFSNGADLTAEDVKFTYEVIGHPDYDGPRGYAIANLVGVEEFKSGAADNIKGIEVRDAKTVAFTYQAPAPANIADLVYGIMSKDHYQFTEWNQFLELMVQPLGSGLLVLDGFEPKQFTDLSRNENYWDPDNGISIDGVLITDVPKESLLGAMQTNQIDFCQADLNVENYEAFNALPNASVTSFTGNGYTFMCFNTTRDKLSDVRVRQALMYALDRKAFIDAEYSSDLASVGLAPFSPTSWAFPDLSDLNAYDFDLAKAEALMNEAGWVKNASGMLEKNGEIFSISWLVYTEASWPGTLSGLAADTWKQLGVDLKIELLDFNSVADRTMDAAPGEKDFDIYTMGFSLSADPDPSGALFDADAYTTGGFNASGYRNDRAQELIKLGREEFDQSKREAYYKEFGQLMNEEIPTVIVAYRNELWPVNDRVQGLELGSFTTWPFVLRDITLS